MIQSQSVAVSAPGKVLLAGGYLVLDRKYTGLVFGLDARIHVCVSPVRTSPGVILSEIIVQSPQFLDAIWEYGYRLSPGNGGMQVTELRADADLRLTRNLFIETALSYTLTYISTFQTHPLPSASITILADNAYYSTPSSAGPLSRFHSFACPLSAAHKTGLGSSAALVTAFTAALLRYYLPRESFSLDGDMGKRRLHNLAQAAHCAAQGKVGSGFDVASAVYGSCVYRRFSPDLLAGCGEIGTKGFATRLREVVDETGEGGPWDTEVVKGKVAVPKGLRLVMCDVKGGSQTPGMVKKVLKWREAEGESAEEFWGRLQSANEGLAKEMVKVADEGSAEYGALKSKLNEIRGLIREMSERSGVPIEPVEQTKLIDACSEVEGVIGGVVPGAGGYDAISLLIEDRQEVADKLAELVKGWDFGGEGKVSVLPVREEMEGVRSEQADGYRQWTD
ncbi:ERG8, Phosphomevalonate kinase [Elsinoe ampelina]|uniref:Phosphomevalonate kinase n=1 Tax=Elsinoe ampelina TaxID=302913 RepID=A0A6A6GND4_9PEZI|nr:ERG8, Phosphomevalonate kinase [Elsinoe ampelina]